MQERRGYYITASRKIGTATIFPFVIRQFVIRSGGMTIVELMIAFTILIILTTALGAFLSTGLTLWSAGEKNKNVYDRTEKIISQIKDDIKNIYIENRLTNNTTPSTLFYCDMDENKIQRLRFVISRNNVSAPPRNLYADLYDVSYILDTTNKTLRRGEREIDNGVLYIAYKFWTQYTTTWDDKVPLAKASGGYNAQVGPSTIWDSERKMRNFIFYTRARSADQPDFVYPSCVKITLVLEPQPPITIKPLDTVSASDSRIRLERANQLPPAPGFVKIDSEWIEYKDIIGDAIIVAQRGARNTSRQEHNPDSKTTFGYTFTYEIPIPAFRSTEYEE